MHGCTSSLAFAQVSAKLCYKPAKDRTSSSLKLGRDPQLGFDEGDWKNGLEKVEDFKF
jgi:hypothetical protein